MSDVVTYEQLEKAIGYSFHNEDLLRQALTHRSFLNEHPEFTLGHNERLEFLGDAVLELAVTELLYREYTETSEGLMTNYRAALVKGSHLAEVGKRLGLYKFIALSRGEREDESSVEYITANAVEALIAAIYLDSDLEQAIQFVYRFVATDLTEIIQKKLYIDAKSLLQELLQEEVSVTPRYELLKSWGPDHDKLFEVQVYQDSEVLASGQGKSKQKAEQAAAEEVLKKRGLR